MKTKLNQVKLESLNKKQDQKDLKKTFDILTPKEKNLFDILQKNWF